MPETEYIIARITGVCPPPFFFLEQGTRPTFKPKTAKVDTRQVEGRTIHQIAIDEATIEFSRERARMAARIPSYPNVGYLPQVGPPSMPAESKQHMAQLSKAMPEFVSRGSNHWTKQSVIVAVEIPNAAKNRSIPFLITIEGHRLRFSLAYDREKCIELDPVTVGGWALRAITDKSTGVDYEELCEFLEKTKSSIFGFFKVSQAENDHVYLLVAIAQKTGRKVRLLDMPFIVVMTTPGKEPIPPKQIAPEKSVEVHA